MEQLRIEQIQAQIALKCHTIMIRDYLELIKQHQTSIEAINEQLTAINTKLKGESDEK